MQYFKYIHRLIGLCTTTPHSNTPLNSTKQYRKSVLFSDIPSNSAVTRASCDAREAAAAAAAAEVGVGVVGVGVGDGEEEQSVRVYAV